MIFSNFFRLFGLPRRRFSPWSRAHWSLKGAQNTSKNIKTPSGNHPGTLRKWFYEVSFFVIFSTFFNFSPCSEVLSSGEPRRWHLGSLVSQAHLALLIIALALAAGEEVPQTATEREIMRAQWPRDTRLPSCHFDKKWCFSLQKLASAGGY